MQRVTSSMNSGRMSPSSLRIGRRSRTEASAGGGGSVSSTMVPSPVDRWVELVLAMSAGNTQQAKPSANPKMRRLKMACRLGRTSATALILLACAAAHGAECPREGTLGTSRVMRVDPATWPQVGTRNFAQTLPLGDHEVVLTFDDGPWPATTPRVLR